MIHSSRQHIVVVLREDREHALERLAGGVFANLLGRASKDNPIPRKKVPGLGVVVRVAHEAIELVDQDDVNFGLVTAAAAALIATPIGASNRNPIMAFTDENRSEENGN